MVIRNHGGNLSLLEHDLRHEDGVGIAGPAPGQVTSVFAIPRSQCAAEFSFWKGHR